MIKNIIECDFEFNSSLSISEVGFESSGKYILTEGLACNCPLGLPNTKIEILVGSENKSIFKVKVETFDLNDQNSQISYLNRLSNYFSFLASRDDCNAHYGTFYIKLNYKSFKSTPCDVEDYNFVDNTIFIDSVLRLDDHLSISMTRYVKLNKDKVKAIKYDSLLEFYYNGLKAESEKSKFFNWFLIMESLEGCEKYNRLFPTGTMFLENEIKQIRTFANNFSDDKKSALLNVLSRTSEYRANKLLALLQSIELNEITYFEKNQSIDIEMIKKIIASRNKLFHRGTQFDKDVLWRILFPLVSAIVEKIISEEECLE